LVSLFSGKAKKKNTKHTHTTHTQQVSLTRQEKIGGSEKKGKVIIIAMEVFGFANDFRCIALNLSTSLRLTLTCTSNNNNIINNNNINNTRQQILIYFDF